MTTNFSPSWVSCIDKSMSKWVNPYTCPGFMVVPRKPWLFGNEYHTIACGESEIIFGMDLIEGKDVPPQHASKEFAELGKTVGMMLRLAKPLFGTSSVLVMDSGFCIVKGLVELKKGVCLQASLSRSDATGLAMFQVTKWWNTLTTWRLAQLTHGEANWRVKPSI